MSSSDQAAGKAEAPVTLRRYFVEVYQHTVEGRELTTDRRAVCEFIKFLGRDPKLVAITPNMLRRFGQQLRETLPEYTAVKYERRVRRIMRNIDPSKFPRYRTQPGQRPKKPALKRRRHSLLTYFENHYRSGRKLADKTAVFYGSAISKLNTFTGRDTALGEITPGLIGRFIEWGLIEDTIDARTVFQYGKVVADVLHDARPEQYAAHATEWRDVFGNLAGRRHRGKPKPAHELAERYIREKEPNADYAENIVRAIRSVEAYAGSAVVPSGLTTELVSDWLTSLQDGTRSNTTVRQYRAILIAVWNWCADLGMCDPPIARRIKRIKVVTPIPVAWTLPNVLQLLSAIDKLDGMVGEMSAAMYWGSLCRTAYDTGLRRGDLLTMTADNLQGGLIVCRQGKTQKVAAKPLRAGTLAAVEAMGIDGRQLIWPWPYGRQVFSKRFRRIVKSAGLTGTFKYLRRTSGTLVEATHPGAGPAHLSHSSRKVFEDHYLDFRQTADSQPMPPSLDEPTDDDAEGGAV